LQSTSSFRITSQY